MFQRSFFFRGFQKCFAQRTQRVSSKMSLHFNLNRVLYSPSNFMYPNFHLPGLSSQTLPHNRVEFVVGSSLQPLLLVHVFFRVLLFSSLRKKTRHFKIPILLGIQASHVYQSQDLYVMPSVFKKVDLIPFKYLHSVRIREDHRRLNFRGSN